MRFQRMFSLPAAETIAKGVNGIKQQADKFTKELLAGDKSLDRLRHWMAQNGELESEQSRLTFGQHVSTNEAVRLESRKAQEALNKYFLEVYNDKHLFEHINETLKPVLESKTLGEQEERLFSDLHRDFVHNGLLLNDEDRQQVKQIKEQLQKLSLDFSTAIADDKTTVSFTKEQLEGMSDDYFERMDKDGDKYVLKMNYPSVTPVYDNCTVEATREHLDSVYTSRCPENIGRLEKAVKLRYELAKLLGYDSFSDYILVNRMAKKPETVWDFLKDLRSKLTPPGQKELKVLEDLKGAPLQAYDYRYYHNLLKKTKYAVDEKVIQQYFPVEHVLTELLNFYQTIFDLKIKPIKGSVWHEDVKIYSVVDKQTDFEYGTFYVDMFPRDGKYTHAACFQLQPACKLSNGSTQPAIAALVCNFTKPSASSPSLLEHSELVTLAHELGHVFHVLSSVTEYAQQQGTNTAWDFVEAPSQMLENFAYEAPVLKKLSKHYKTNEPLPDEQIEKLVAARNVNEALFNLRQLFFGHFDMTLHNMAKWTDVNVNELYAELKGKITLMPHHAGTFGASTFGHIMGGYQSAYYSYMWSLVYAADMYSEFKRRGYTDPKVGRDYRVKVLQPGGSLDELENVRKFLGRAPSNDAFLKHLGLK